MDLLKLLGRLFGAAAEEPVPAKKPAARRPASGTRRKPAQKRRSTAGGSRRTGSTVGSRQIYGEEPIFRTAAQLSLATPQPIRTMRTFSAGRYNHMSMEALFYRQGKYMEHYTDDFPDAVPCRRAVPMYYNLNDAELRTYFTWRTRYRQGMLPETDTGYLMLYCSELINLIGVPDAQTGYAMLCRVYDDYAAAHPQLKKALDRWLPDFAAYYEVPHRQNDEKTAALTAVLRHTQKTPQELLEALDTLSKYHILQSKYYLKNPERTAEITQRAYAAMLKHYAEDKNLSFPALLLGEKRREQHILFEGAVLYQQNEIDERIVRLSPLCVYRCWHGGWAVERYCCDPDAARIGDFLRTVDSLLRVHDKFPNKLKPGELLDSDLPVIADVIRAYDEEIRRKNAPVITLDSTELDEIRRAAAHTADMLTLPEETPEPVQAEPVQAQTAPAAAEMQDDTPDDLPDLPLSKPALALLICLVTGESTKPLTDAGQMLSVLAEEINEALYDTVGDAVIDTDETGQPVLIEDYAEEVKGLLGQ